MSLKLKINTKDWFLYMILIPFLYPRGFSEYIPVYKTFFTLWLYGAMIGISLMVLFEISNRAVSIRTYNCWLTLYFAVMIFLTLLIRKSFNAGLQKMFATPALCVLCAIYLKKNPKALIKCLNNLLTIIFLLNFTIFNPLLWEQYFSPIENHITFLGHVQINTQLGVVGIFFACLGYCLNINSKKEMNFQVILSVITMILSFTNAAYMALILLIMFWLFEKFGIKKSFISKAQIYACLYILINACLFIFITYKGISLSIAGFSLNGRGHIWREALNTFFKNPIHGYGVHGVLIKVFWSAWTGNGQGMNYMHNQILQVLNDGGVMLFIPYIFMIFSCIKNLNKIQSKKLQFWLSVCMIIMLFVMTFESVMDYFYVFFVFMTVSYLPEIQTKVPCMAAKINYGSYKKEL